MHSFDVIGKSIAAMDDHQLIQRWKDGQFGDADKAMAEDELRCRLHRGVIGRAYRALGA